jgi:hypothetical protein
MFDPGELIAALSAAQVEYVVIGGFAVGAHGFPRATKDLDVVPAGGRENLVRLAAALVTLGAEHHGTGDIDPAEFPYDPLDPDELAQGGNFLLATNAGRLDVMQWVPGIDADRAYDVLAPDAIAVPFRGVTVRICSLAHLRQMKQAAGRPQDAVDLENLPVG